MRGKARNVAVHDQVVVQQSCKKKLHDFAARFTIPLVSSGADIPGDSLETPFKLLSAGRLSDSFLLFLLGRNKESSLLSSTFSNFSSTCVI